MFHGACPGCCVRQTCGRWKPLSVFVQSLQLKRPTRANTIVAIGLHTGTHAQTHKHTHKHETNIPHLIASMARVALRFLASALAIFEAAALWSDWVYQQGSAADDTCISVSSDSSGDVVVAGGVGGVAQRGCFCLIPQQRWQVFDLRRGGARGGTVTWRAPRLHLGRFRRNVPG